MCGRVASSVVLEEALEGVAVVVPQLALAVRLVSDELALEHVPIRERDRALSRVHRKKKSFSSPCRVRWWCVCVRCPSAGRPSIGPCTPRHSYISLFPARLHGHW